MRTGRGHQSERLGSLGRLLALTDEHQLVAGFLSRLQQFRQSEQRQLSGGIADHPAINGAGNRSKRLAPSRFETYDTEHFRSFGIVIRPAGYRLHIARFSQLFNRVGCRGKRLSSPLRGTLSTKPQSFPVFTRFRRRRRCRHSLTLIRFVEVRHVQSQRIANLLDRTSDVAVQQHAAVVALAD